MKEQCDEMLKQYGIFGCTDFSFPLKSEHPVLVKPPTHPNPNVVRNCKSVRNIGQSLITILKTAASRLNLKMATTAQRLAHLVLMCV